MSPPFFVEMAFGGKYSSKRRKYSVAKGKHYYLIIRKEIISGHTLYITKNERIFKATQPFHQLGRCCCTEITRTETASLSQLLPPHPGSSFLLKEMKERDLKRIPVFLCGVGQETFCIHHYH